MPTTLKMLVVRNGVTEKLSTDAIAFIKDKLSQKVVLDVSFIEKKFDSIPTTPTEENISEETFYWYEKNIRWINPESDIVILMTKQIPGSFLGWAVLSSTPGPLCAVTTDQGQATTTEPGKKTPYSLGTYYTFLHEMSHILYSITKQKDITHNVGIDESIAGVDASKIVTVDKGIKGKVLSLLYKALALAQYALGLAIKQKEEETPVTPQAPEKKNFITLFADAIQEYEGWYKGSRSYRNNNPGNLRWASNQTGTDSSGFAIFATYEEGYNALVSLITRAAQGKVQAYNKHAVEEGFVDSTKMSITNFFEVYSPTSDSNIPDKYAIFVSNKIGVPATTKLETLV